MATRYLLMVVMVCGLVSACSGLRLGSTRPKATSDATQKDCAACEKMCKVAGDKEGKGAESCIADCQKSCS